MTAYFKEQRDNCFKNRFQDYKAKELVELYNGVLVESEMIKSFLEGGTFSVDIEMVERSKPTTLDYIYYYDVTNAKYKYSKGVSNRIKYDIDYEFDDSKAGLEALRIDLDLEEFEKCVKIYADLYNNKNKYNPLPYGCFFTRESYGFHVLRVEKKKAFKGAKIIETKIRSGGEHH